MPDQSEAPIVRKLLRFVNDEPLTKPPYDEIREAAEIIRLCEEALTEVQSFVGVMCGRGADAVIPETIATPLGIPVKIGAIMRDVATALAQIKGKNP